jgi:hypothetical protein
VSLSNSNWPYARLLLQFLHKTDRIVNFTLQYSVSRTLSTVKEGLEDVEDFLRAYGYILPATNSNEEYYEGELTALALKSYSIIGIWYSLSVSSSTNSGLTIVRLQLVATNMPSGIYARIRVWLSFHVRFRLKITLLSGDMMERINVMV